ncbi:ParB N-terminal domain-containing protein [Micromonospora sp. KLBMP9576]|uniref:ParB N-terminal domain-containing protein n=1 Tax=Micromonospora sp. KLBMP9576 TaxID=3424769 RepID=UPI003D8C2DDD
MTAATVADPVLRRLLPVPLSDLVLHEDVEPARLRDVVAGLRSAGVQRNPILVTPFGGRWLVIDGAHRTSALRHLGATHALVQSFAPREYQLDAWHHLLDGTLSGVLRGGTTSRCPACGGGAGTCLATVLTGGAVRHLWCPTTEVTAAARLMAGLVRRYAHGAGLRRVPARDPGGGVGKVRVAWRPWSVDRLRQVVSAGSVLPTGVTRFIVPGRVLNVGLPLSLLTAPGPDGAEGIGAHLTRRRYRYYAEPVFLAE